MTAGDVGLMESFDQKQDNHDLVSCSESVLELHVYSNWLTDSSDQHWDNY